MYDKQYAIHRLVLEPRLTGVIAVHIRQWFSWGYSPLLLANMTRVAMYCY